MTGDTTRHDAHTLIGAYVLDAVSDAERRLFEEHLAGCPTCAQETAELLETTAVLAGETAAEPPAHLRERVLASVAATPQLPPAKFVFADSENAQGMGTCTSATLNDPTLCRPTETQTSATERSVVRSSAAARSSRRVRR